MDKPILPREDDGLIAVLALNNPARPNALCDALLDALAAEMKRLAAPTARSAW